MVNKSMLILSDTNPLYNTMLIFTVIMITLFLTKPNLIYCSKTNRFRQFGTSHGDTLIPIYIIGILLAVILYVFFYSIMKKKDMLSHPEQLMSERYNGYNNKFMHNLIPHSLIPHNQIPHNQILPHINDGNFNQIYLMQQQQINTLNNQIQQLLQQQMISNSMGINHMTVL